MSEHVTPHLETAAEIDDPELLLHRVPEISLLRGSVQDEVIDVFIDDVPGYFWIARASENHHPPDERGLGGTWLHTKRVFTAYVMLERSFRAMSRIDSFEANCARAAVLLHDAFKYGKPGTEYESKDEDQHPYAGGALYHAPKHTIPEHDVQMASWIRDETELPDEVAQCVESHGGSNSWMSHSGPEPQDDKSLLVHLADLVASNSNHRLPVYRPTNELRMMVGTVPELTEQWFEDAVEF